MPSAFDTLGLRALAVFARFPTLGGVKATGGTDVGQALVLITGGRLSVRQPEAAPC